MKKTHIFAYAELEKLVGNLTPPEANVKDRLLNQVAYFHIIDSRYLSDDLAPAWDALRQKVGYSSTDALKGQQFLKNTMLKTMQQVSEDECREIVGSLTQLFERVQREFSL